MRRRWWSWVRASALVLPIVLLCADIFARAGGGGGYHGGGGGGGGHSGGGYSGGGHGGGGGSDGLGWLILQLIRLIMLYPAVGVPAVIVVVIFFIVIQRQASSVYQTSVIRRGGSLLDDNARAAMIATLRESDSAFDESAFYARAASAFLKIQQAWSKQDLQSVRPFISDAVYERFNLQFDEQRALGYRNAMENVVVNGVVTAQVRPDHLFDELSIRIEAGANDFNVALADGSRIAGSDDSGEFAEFWTFLRRRGVQTNAGKEGLIEGHCPNCGALISINQNANCAHCGAMLRSGQYDWVLAEITQESEWVASERTDMSSVRAMIARDPEFNLQDMEDRASVMFWRRAAAERTGKVEPLRKIASPEFCESYAAELKARTTSGGARQFYGECAVGSVDTLGLVTDNEWDRAMVEVRWEGGLFEVEPGGAIRRTPQRSLSRTVLELSRRVGVRSDAGHAISSSHCPNCGAPESGGTSGACEFCGAVLNDGTRTWVLTAIRTPAEARQLLSELRDNWSGDQPVGADTGGSEPGMSPPSVAGMLAWMIQMAAADGQIDVREAQMLSSVAQRRNVPAERVEGMLSAAQNGRLDVPTPTGLQETKQWLSAMASEGLADGKLTRDEYALLLDTGRRAGLVEYDVREIIEGQRRKMLTAARQALRDKRTGNNGASTGTT